MSAERERRWGDLVAEETAEYDPYDIIPADFPYASIEHARRAVEAGFGGHIDDPRCPDCLSPNIVGKPGGTAADCEHKRGEDFRCEKCGGHFDAPMPSPDERAAGEQASMEVFER